MRTIVCHHCGRRVISNKKLKHLVQHYCGNIECQGDRKVTFDRNKYKNNREFRIRKLEKVKEKRKRQQGQNHPQYPSEYQRAYRESHPEYVLKNKEKQRERYVRSLVKRSPKTKIVNPDTLTLEPADNERVYALFAIDHKKIVNPDTLLLERIERLPFTDEKPLFVRLL